MSKYSPGPIEWEVKWGPACLVNFMEENYLIDPGNRIPVA